MLFRIESSKGNDPDKCHPQSHTYYQFLNKPEKDKRLQRLHQQSRINQQRAEGLKVRLERATELRGTVVGEDLHGDLKQIMEENSPFIAESYPQESFARSFWESQQRASSLKDARSMRWDPLMIRWCLYLHHLSGSAYEMLRESGVIKLPSQRTLRDYTYYTKATTGFSDEVDRKSTLALRERSTSSPLWMKCISGRMLCTTNIQVWMLVLYTCTVQLLRQS